ncbi:MAG: carbon storage regulator CsrA, partial [Solirubrobacteraceae bacterium]
GRGLMLNITRRRGERIVLGDDVFISVLEVSGQTVRLGIDAPRSVRVYREEIWLEVKRENEAAAAGTDARLPADVPAPLVPDASTSITRGVGVSRSAPRS